MTAAASHLSLDSSGHPDIETISEYVEDLLAPQAAAELSAHLTGCADCRESRDALDEIRALLGQTEVPPIPDDIAQRIDAALADAALDVDADADTAAKPSQAASATGGGGAGRSATRTAPSGPTGPFSPVRPASPSRPGAAGPGRKVARRVRRAALGVAALAACGLFVTAVLNLPGSSSSKGASSSSAAVGRVAGAGQGTAGSQSIPFSRGGFTQQIQTLLAAPTPTSGVVQPQAQGSESGVQHSNSGTGRLGTDLPSCVLAVVPGQHKSLLAAATGTYRGQAVYALVYPDSADPAHKVDAFLVSADCLTPAEYTSPVLLQNVVPRA